MLRGEYSMRQQDPIPDDIAILPTQRIIIVEGNYLCFLPPEPNTSDPTHPTVQWATVARLFDERWFLDTPVEMAKDRLAKRHFAAGIVDTMEKGEERANGSDMQNARDILQWRYHYHRRITGSNIFAGDKEDQSIGP
jgi:pantothenate kinase